MHSVAPTSTSTTPNPAPPGPAVAAWLRHGLANTAIVVGLALAGWWLLADPRWSPLDIYPLPFNGYLFWAMIFVVFAGFNLEFAPYARIPQPWRGLAISASALVFAVVMTLVMAYGLGHFYPDFAAGRDGGLGYFTAALFVLFAFATYVMAVVNWQHQPWTALGLKQPLTGACEIAFLMVPTLAIYWALGLPAISEVTTPGSALMSLDVVLGWFYCMIVVIVATGALLENKPWSWLRGPVRLVAGSTLGVLAIGTVLYFVLVPAARLLVGPANADVLGDVINQFPAQLGVCWVFAMVLWGNAFGNIGRPVVRVVVTLGIAVGVFLLYYFVLAGTILHEPAVVPGATIHGNALGFVDVLILATLLYTVAGESWGLRRPAL